MTNSEIMKRESNLVQTIQEKLPDFVKACADDVEVVVLHQDAFAADYQDDEYRLLGMAVKFAGLSGKEVRVVGKNRQTVGEQDSVHWSCKGGETRNFAIQPQNASAADHESPKTIRRRFWLLARRGWGSGAENGM
jgi:hypothetical protein